MQSKRMSLIEALTNIGVGMLISFLAQLWLFPRYGIHVSTSDNVEIVLDLYPPAPALGTRHQGHRRVNCRFATIR